MLNHLWSSFLLFGLCRTLLSIVDVEVKALAELIYLVILLLSLSASNRPQQLQHYHFSSLCQPFR